MRLRECSFALLLVVTGPSRLPGDTTTGLELIKLHNGINDVDLGADCVLHDFRLFRDRAHHSAVLIMADRKPGANFADAQQVTFTFYRLARNRDEQIGRGIFYFKYDRDVKSKAPYCDVGKAFQAELGIGMDKKGAARD